MPPQSNYDMVLAGALKDLLRHWAQTDLLWRDQARAEFGKACIEPLEPAVRRAVGALGAVAQLIHQAARECR
jgi:hypothetical protein